MCSLHRPAGISPIGFGLGFAHPQAERPCYSGMVVGPWVSVEQDPRVCIAVSCETWALEVAVIPAKAGIHSANVWKCAVDGLDSRFRGNDRRFERDPIQKDTSTQKYHSLTPQRR